MQAQKVDPAALDYSGFSALYQPLMESLDVPFREVIHHAGNNEGKSRTSTSRSLDGGSSVGSTRPR